ncbi:MAG: rhodanese-like domain-containing protein [Phycisphaeraceae bacterium]|nr:rhodanese-like domain-containing protein [Phycisphaeraceae bacterium]
MNRESHITGVVSALCLVFVLISVGCQQKISDRDIVVIDLAETRILHAARAARFVDSRGPEEFAAGRIAGSLNLQLPQVSEVKTEMEPSIARAKTVVVYGNNPGSGVAKAIAKRLMIAGHKGVRLYAGGMDEWRANNLPVEQAPRAAE